MPRRLLIPIVVLPLLLVAGVTFVYSQNEAGNEGKAVPDAAADAVQQRNVEKKRPEQQLTDHDRSDKFNPAKPAPISEALKSQPKEGRITGFDFARDPLNADKPFTTFEEVRKKEEAARPEIMTKHRQLLESRYNLEPKLDPE